MSVKFNFILTEEGQNALWKEQNNGVDFEITHIDFGSSSAQVGIEYEAVKLSKSEQYSEVASGSRISETQIRIYAKLVPEKDFPIHEIGLWSGEPNKDGSILFAYVAQEKLFGSMVIGVDFIFSYDMVFTTGDIDSITIIADSDSSVVLSMLAQHELAYDPHPYYAHKEKDNLFKAVNTFEKPIVASITGNSATATKATTADKLATARKIQGVEFDGTKDINLSVFSSNNSGLVPQSGYTTGTANKYLREDGTWGIIDIDFENVDHSKTADKLKTARTIGISGAVTGTATSFDGSTNITIPTTAVDATKLNGIVPSANLNGNYNINISGTASLATRANSADKLTTARRIQGVAFDGTQDINIFNSTGNAPSYACRAWVNFDGSNSSNIVVRASSNILSVTSSGTGTYRVNFIEAMPIYDYSIGAFCSDVSTSQRVAVVTCRSDQSRTPQGVDVVTRYSGQNASNIASPIVCVQIFC